MVQEGKYQEEKAYNKRHGGGGGGGGDGGDEDDKLFKSLTSAKFQTACNCISTSPHTLSSECPNESGV